MKLDHLQLFSTESLRRNRKSSGETVDGWKFNNLILALGDVLVSPTQIMDLEWGG
jgi:hypothetical protein